MIDLGGKNDKGARKERKNEGAGAREEVGPERTEIFGEEDYVKGVDAERDNFRDDHINMPAEHQKSRIKTRSAGKIAGTNKTYQIATMMSSSRINAVNEMATVLKNWFSNRTRAMIVAADGTVRPAPVAQASCGTRASVDVTISFDIERDAEGAGRVCESSILAKNCSGGALVRITSRFISK